MAIRDTLPEQRIGGQNHTLGARPTTTALWQARNNRSTGDRRADHDKAIQRTLASSSNPALLFDHVSDDAKGWH